MATLTTFRAGGVCRACRAYGRVWVNNTYGDQGATYVIGDDVSGDVDNDLASDSLVVNEPQPGEPIRLLGTWTCETCRRYSFAELVVADGWLVDVRAVEPNAAVLDRLHYIPTYESEAIADLLGRSIWDEQGIWPGWLPALRAALARREAAAPEAHGDGEFPLGGTLDSGRYKLVDHYLGNGADQLWFARSAADPTARYLVSTTINNGLDLSSDAPSLMRTGRDLFAPRFVGAFDLAGDGSAADQERRATVGYVEQVPAGWPLTLTQANTAGHAFRLGAQVGERLLAAANSGVLDVGLRPELVWITMRGIRPEVTGIGGRNRDFFAAAIRRRDLRTAPLFTRRYVAPEVHRGESFDDRALVLTLAVITAEWLLGRYPYEDGDGAYGYNRLCRGEHLELPPAARSLAPALSPDPAVRPDLASFTRTLARL